MSIKLLDCTLRDGGYHNLWDFSADMITEYLGSMLALGVDYVELGFRSLDQSEFRGATAFTTDRFLATLDIPDSLKIGVMINAAELSDSTGRIDGVLDALFSSSDRSRVDLVRIATHHHQLDLAVAATEWLHERGYQVGLNMMQISQRTAGELESVAKAVEGSPLDVLYFADSLGSLVPDQVAEIIHGLRSSWSGEIGIHTHDNTGNAVANSLRAIAEGVTWVDGTVTGMGRGAGNAKTEYLAIELASVRGEGNVAPLLTLIERHFEPLRKRYGWGTNYYYYLAGKYGIHPTYIQQMLVDRRYSTEDLHAVIGQLRQGGGKKYSASTLEAARHFYSGEPRGSWRPEAVLAGRDVLILGTGPGATAHRKAVEAYVESARPFVIALNTQQAISAELIVARAACHPVRLLADCAEHLKLRQPLITPGSMLPERLRNALAAKEILDYGLVVEPDTFDFHETYSVIPAPLVMAYVLAVCAAGGARRILLAGFDGYEPGDPRNDESERVFQSFIASGQVPPMVAVTPTSYKSVASTSIYRLLG